MRETLWAMCVIGMAGFATWQLRGGHTGIDADILSLIGQENADQNGPQSDITTVRHLLQMMGGR